MAVQAIARWAQVVIDVSDIEQSAAFWGQLLGVEPSLPRSDGQWLTVGPLEGARWLVLQQVPEPKTVKNRVHLDFTVGDVNDAISRIIALAGRQIREVRGRGGWFVTMADPDGNEFCIGAYSRARTGERVQE